MANPSIQLDAMAGWFSTNGYFTLTPGTTYTLELKDGVTGVGGDGDFTIVLASNELTVYGVGTNGPAYHVVKRNATNPVGQGFDLRVHKVMQYLVVNGVVAGQRDLRVLGGVDATNLDPASLSNTGNNINTGTTLQSITGTAPISVLGGGNAVVSLPFVLTGTGVPAASLNAPVGALYLRTDDVGETYVASANAATLNTWKRVPRKMLRIKMLSADFTPALGVDFGGLSIVPFDPETGAAMNWTVVGFFFRVETAAVSGVTSIKVQRSVGSGAFSNTGYLNTTAFSIAAGAYENGAAATLAVTSIASGDKLKAEVTALGVGAASFTFYVILKEL